MGRVVSMQSFRALKREAGRFDVSQMRSWESDRPWNLTREDAEAQLVPGWWGKSARGTESASWEKGYIRPSPEFFTYPEDTRRAIAYHEAGHAMIEAAGGLGSIEDPLGMISLPGGQTLGYNAEEILAEGYSVLWCEPSWFDRSGAQEIRSIVIAMAKRTGFPLPSSAKTAMPSWRRASAAASVTLYHGTDQKRVDDITGDGLTPPPGMGSMNGWYMLTTSFDQARRYAMGDSPVVIEYQIPLSRIYRETDDGPGDLLWPGVPHGAYDFDAIAYAPRVPIPGSMITKVHGFKKTAMPSWRGLVDGPIWSEYPAVLLVDKTGGGRQSYEVYIAGEWVARTQRLEEGKAYIERKIGPCEFRRVKLDPIKADTFAWGTVDWLGDPSIAYAAVPV